MTSPPAPSSLETSDDLAALHRELAANVPLDGADSEPGWRAARPERGAAPAPAVPAAPPSPSRAARPVTLIARRVAGWFPVTGSLLNDASEVLRRVFGYDSFRGQQLEIIEHVAAERRRAAC